MRRAIFWVAIWLAAGPAAALAEQIRVVPESQTAPNLPHPVHEQAQVTLKATIRDAECAIGNGYTVWWDVDQDGDYADELSKSYTRNGTTHAIWDIGRTMIVPNVPRDQSMNINVKVRNNCDASEMFGTFRMFVYDFTPDSDPREWPAYQLELMSHMAVNEALWYLYRDLVGFSGYDTAQFSARNTYTNTTPLAAWIFIINGHMPAYRPGTINDFGTDLPDGWEAGNDARYALDPYAEAAMRMMNYAVNRSGPVNLPAAEEGTRCGYDENGDEVECVRIAGTTNRKGAYQMGTYNVYRQGMGLGPIATALPALAGTPIQVGPATIRGHTWEWFTQELVDLLGYEQIDGGCSRGAYYYTIIDGARHCGYADLSTSQWAFIGHEAAEIAGGPYGVFVDNRHKYRIADHLQSNQRASGGGAYRSSSGRDDLKLTGGNILAARWLGVHEFDDDDDEVAFPGHSTLTRGALRTIYDDYLSFTAAEWTSSNRRGSHWLDGFWQLGDYLCGDTDGVNSQPRCGNTYSMYSHQKGYRTGASELLTVGGHNWGREFNTYYIRAQNRTINADPFNYPNFGQVRDDYCANHSVTCVYGAGHLSTAMAGLVLTPTIFSPKPVALAVARPSRVIEGCAGAGAGRVTFDHSASFSPNDDAYILSFEWDVDDSDGLWWDDDPANPDLSTPGVDGVVHATLDHTYMQAGDYIATLRVTDSLGYHKTTTVEVQVDPSANVPPAANANGPYASETGAPLTLNGEVTDQNLGCGDELTVDWDLDGDGDFDDFSGPAGLVPWGPALAGIPLGVATPIRMRVVDDAGEVTISETVLRIYPREPVAVILAGPNPAGCGQAVQFNGANSSHPNPARSIVQYEWDLDGVGGMDAAGGLVQRAFPSFGTYPITLRVTDDLGRTDEASIEVDVNQGNRPPVARSTQPEYSVLEGDNLILDGRNSSDEDTPCGDAIVSYEWDLDGDGAFGGAADVAGANPNISWMDLSAAIGWDPDAAPMFLTVRLRVTDSFGAQSELALPLIARRGAPIAQIVQTPSPAPINLVSGVSLVHLDGRESHSPIPGMALINFEWDLDDDGVFEVQNQALTDFAKVFAPVPAPANIPDVFVRLRVTDAEGRRMVARYRIVYRMPPTEPTADADPTDPPEQGYHILAGQGVTLDASQSFDPDTADFGDVIRWYRWDLSYNVADGFQVDQAIQDADGDGAEAVLELTAAELANFGLDVPGNYTVRVQVEDTTLLTNEDNAQLIVHPQDPTAVFGINPNPTTCGGLVTLDAHGSQHTHPDIEVVAWRWDLDGDGEYDDAVGQVVNHRFEQFTFGNPVLVGLEVEDSRGNTGRRVVPVVVDQGNQPPVGDAGGPYVVGADSPLSLDGSRSSEPDALCGDTIVEYAWDLDGDGITDAVGASPVIPAAVLAAHGLGEPNVYVINLTVTDRFGASTLINATVNVFGGPEAVAVANPNRTGCNVVIRLDGSGSTWTGPAEGGFEIVEWVWDLDGDGVFDDAEGAFVDVPAIGRAEGDGISRMRAHLRVTDGGGRTSIAEAVVEVDVMNLPPVADPGGPYIVGPDGAGGFVAAALDARGSSDSNIPCDSIVRYAWDTDLDGQFGADDGGGDLEGAQVDFVDPTWAANTVRTVRLIACDERGLCSPPVEAEITISDVAPPTGEVISPRVENGVVPCLAAGPFTVDLRVGDPTGADVTVTILINGNVLGQDVVSPPAGGAMLDVAIEVDTTMIPEGRHDLEVTFANATHTVRADAGGRLTFDRTAPEITIGAQPVEGLCYLPQGVPEPTVNVVDALDPAPVVTQNFAAVGCAQSLAVEAVDSCGNTANGQRSYRIASPLQLLINGANEGELATTARLTWDVMGPADCVAGVTAVISHNGLAFVPYAENTLVVEPGEYTLRITASNCLGLPTVVSRSLVINGDPIVEVIPPGHPAQDPMDLRGYRAIEGGGLQVDGSSSRPPELNDAIVLYEWDFNNDGIYDADGVVASFPTDDHGNFQGRLRVTDSLGRTASDVFGVTVTDVDPIPDAGGPYVVNEGVPVQMNGSARPGSLADLVTRYNWTWGDGSPVDSGADLRTPEHIFAEQGTYLVSLLVDDEDSSAVATARVEVFDVNPIINQINPPDDPTEILLMTFSVDVDQGSPADPIVTYEWDMNGDGVADVAGPGHQTVQWIFRDAGLHTVSVRVRDDDSFSIETIVIDVREVTLAELITYSDERVTAQVADPALPLMARFALRNFDEFTSNGSWGETYGNRGVSLMALDRMIDKMSEAQSLGADFGLPLWALSRQLVREMERQLDRLVDDGNADETSVARAEAYVEQMQDHFSDPNFADDVFGDQADEALNLWASAYEAFFWMQDATDSCNQYDHFDLPEVADPVERARNSQGINNNLTQALGDLSAEMQAYADQGMAGGMPAPGRGEVLTGMPVLSDIQALQPLRIGTVCLEGEICVTDKEALNVELWMMDLASQLQVASANGAYVRQWNACLVDAAKFRIELSLLRVEFVCGLNSEISLEARSAQAIGLELYNDGRRAEAMDFYMHAEQRCLLVSTYNECLVVGQPDLNEPAEIPNFCIED